MNEGNPAGLLGSVRRIFDSLLGLAQSRLQLFSLELESEKIRLVDTLIKLAIVLAVAFIGLLLAAFTVAMFVWEQAGFPGLLIMTGVILATAGILLWCLRSGLRKGPAPFAKTLAEFNKDRSCLGKKD
jgi:uncharacterized membrane protein YqjE